MTSTAKFSKLHLCKRWDGIDEAIKGLVMMNPSLVLLGNERIILRRDHTEMKGKVKILSGGSSEFEPVHSGFVGPGMLTAAVLGETFVSPPSTTVLHAIRELGQGHPEGVLLIVKNYPGDCLNFGVAMEKASCEGLYVKLLLVGEDVTMTVEGHHMKTGGAGTVLIQKIAGAMSELGCSLDQIINFCESIIENDLVTVCIGSKNQLKAPQSPENSHPKEEVQANGSYSTERNIHNQCNCYTEPGNYEVLDSILNQSIENKFNFDTSIPIIIVINCLGGQSKFEEYKFAKESVNFLQAKGYNIVRIYSGSFFSSLLISGFSVSLLKLSSPEILNYVDAPTFVPNWPQKFPRDNSDKRLCSNLYIEPCYTAAEPKEEEDQSTMYLISERNALALLQILNFMTNVLIACESQLNLYDSLAGGDKDCGTNISRGAQAIKHTISTDNLQARNLNMFFKSLSDIVEVSMGGIIGSLYSILFQAASKTCKEVTIFTWFEALHMGTHAVMHYGLCNPGHGSMLDPLQAATDTFSAKLLNYPTDDILSIFEKVVIAAEDEAELTSRMRGGHKPDPGAHAVGLWLRAGYEGYKLLF